MEISVKKHKVYIILANREKRDGIGPKVDQLNRGASWREGVLNMLWSVTTKRQLHIRRNQYRRVFGVATI